MRLSELLDADVVDEGGTKLGDLHDIRVRRQETGHAPLVVEGIITGAGALQARLGYAYGDVGGPGLLRWVLARLGRRARYVPWDRVESFEPGVVTVRGRIDDLAHPSDAFGGTA